MSVFKYEVLNPVIDTQKPFIQKGYFIVPRIGKAYKYLLEVANFNQSTYEKEYYLLLSDTKFDNNCRTCRVDDFGRLKFRPIGEFKEFVEDFAKDNGNITFTYIETENGYDVWRVGE